MRNAPLAMAQQLARTFDAQRTQAHRSFDAVFCSSMLDLPQWRGFLVSLSNLQLSRSDKQARQLNQIATLPTIVYFHENQWTYPTSPQAREDSHYGYTNLLTALAADEVWFNSQFHLRSFLSSSDDFVARMPDNGSSHELTRLREKSRIVPPGFVPFASSAADDSRRCSEPIRIGWVARWEHDKRPDRFVSLLQQLDERGIDFELVLLGARHRKAAPELTRIEETWSDRIRFNGFVKSKGEYFERLREIDIVVSTADHEFFGIAICEAISAGAIPVVPDGLSYPELVDQQFRFGSLPEAVEQISRLTSSQVRYELSKECLTHITAYAMDQVVLQVDDGVERVATSRC